MQRYFEINYSWNDFSEILKLKIDIETITIFMKHRPAVCPSVRRYHNLINAIFGLIPPPPPPPPPARLWSDKKIYDTYMYVELVNTNILEKFPDLKTSLHYANIC